jgi:sensor domain CHASE-containing protein
MSGLHDHVEKKNTRLRKEVRLLREEIEMLKNAAIQKLQRIAQHYGVAGHLQRTKHEQEAP